MAHKISQQERVGAVGEIPKGMERIFNPSPITNYFTLPSPEEGKGKRKRKRKKKKKKRFCINEPFFLNFNQVIGLLSMKKTDKPCLNFSQDQVNLSRLFYLIFYIFYFFNLYFFKYIRLFIYLFSPCTGNVPDAPRNVIYLLPLGSFPAGESPPLDVIKEYLI
jgi:hypothetical protein